ncbi:MAG: ATP-binding cassette domain-containing protein [Prevotellaceae bacterium]|nr:ATP-binding cassette domain-containing protein [Prevotellaceae bacterium]
MDINLIIDFQQVSIFQENTPVLMDITLQIEKGEFVYLIGKVGSGKTSLIKTIHAEIVPEKGYAMVAGYDLNNLKMKDVAMLRRKMGVVFQDFQLLSDRSVYDNLAFVLRATGWKEKAVIDEQIMKVLTKVELKRKAYKMPYQLSGGEQQRVVIARAMLNNPQLIIADEPTGHLDPETSEDIMHILLDINREEGPAVIMATHNYMLMKKHPLRTIKCENNALYEPENETEIDFEGLIE